MFRWSSGLVKYGDYTDELFLYFVQNENRFDELYPYFSDQELLAQSASDHYGLTDPGELKADLQNQFQATLHQLKSAECIIASELRRLSQE